MWQLSSCYHPLYYICRNSFRKFVVIVPPHLKGPVKEEITAEEDEFIEIICPVEGSPPPSILWIKNSVIQNQNLQSR